MEETMLVLELDADIFCFAPLFFLVLVFRGFWENEIKSELRKIDFFPFIVVLHSAWIIEPHFSIFPIEYQKCKWDLWSVYHGQ